MRGLISAGILPGGIKAALNYAELPLSMTTQLECTSIAVSMGRMNRVGAKEVLESNRPYQILDGGDSARLLET